jgi:hypothetical protein
VFAATALSGGDVPAADGGSVLPAAGAAVAVTPAGVAVALVVSEPLAAGAATTGAALGLAAAPPPTLSEPVFEVVVDDWPTDVPTANISIPADNGTAISLRIASIPSW